MATFLSLTNSVLARLNEVQLTSSNFSNARGIQIQAQNAVNESIRYINQREFQYPFNHTTKSQTLSPGIVRYSIPTDAKHVDYNTARIVKDSTIGASGANLSILQYNEYVNNEYVVQEDEITIPTNKEPNNGFITATENRGSRGFSTTITASKTVERTFRYELYDDDETFSTNRTYECAYFYPFSSYQLSVLRDEPTVILNLRKESECFNGIGERGFVVVPQETHKRVRDNLDFYLEKAGLLDKTTKTKAPKRGR